jgi:hypothetical protein
MEIPYKIAYARLLADAQALIHEQFCGEEENELCVRVSKFLKEGRMEAEPDEEKKYTIAHGHAFEGIKLHGVFTSNELAAEHAHACEDIDACWQVVKIEGISF